jgi:hypothetical protein
MVSEGNKVNHALRPAYYAPAEKVSTLFTFAAEVAAQKKKLGTATVCLLSDDSSDESEEDGTDARYCYIYDGRMLPCCYLCITTCGTLVALTFPCFV